MIPIKPISREEAVRLGLAKDQDKGFGIAGVSVIVRGGDGKPDREMEKQHLHKDGRKEIKFMSDERKQEMIKKKQFRKYVEQFDIIEGKTKQEYIKDNKLIFADQEI